MNRKSVHVKKDGTLKKNVIAETELIINYCNYKDDKSDYKSVQLINILKNAYFV